MAQNYFPELVGLEFSEFLSFHNKRAELLREKLIEVLDICESPDGQNLDCDEGLPLVDDDE